MRCVPLSNLFNLSVPAFPHPLYESDDISLQLTELLQGLRDNVDYIQ